MTEETRTVHIETAPTCLTLHKYKLTSVGGPCAGLSQVFDRRLIYIGSSPDTDFPLDDPTVSRAHCKIEGDKLGYKLQDLRSKNGTSINGIRVLDGYVPNGAKLALGDSIVEFNLLDKTVDIELASANRFGTLLGHSLQMREIFAILAKVAPTPATVLIEGESGTGKELVAEAIHEHSPCKGNPFVVFDCSAVPRELLESELFGHIKGAFTGATSDRVGAMQEAHGGTLFIDEIGELSPDLQPKLLRALEKREVKPVGSNKRIHIDVRIIAATNRNLAKEVEANNFREDLYYRLAVIKLQLPPLRNRTEDIPLLVGHFLEEINQSASGGQLQISYETMEKLKDHGWPGNVRELRNFIERAALLAEDGEIETRYIHRMAEPSADSGGVQLKKSEDTSVGQLIVDFDLPFKDAKERLVESFERSYWSRLLHKHGGNISQAARHGGIHRKSLEYLIKKLDIHPKH